MSWRLKTSLILVGIAVALMFWCLFETTALSMTAFFSFGIPFYGLGVILYVWEILLDLRAHRVL
jgi:hypothetical protein